MLGLQESGEVGSIEGHQCVLEYFLADGCDSSQGEKDPGQTVRTSPPKRPDSAALKASAAAAPGPAAQQLEAPGKRGPR